MIKFYKVGGCVRDSYLDRKSKDIDFSVEASSYADMRRAIVDKGGEIFLEQEQFLTIRAKVPEYGAADFVLCRKESHYTDGRHPESVTVGDIYDDLSRRDCTMNAIAIDMDTGNIIDPYNGKQDIEDKIIRCVGKPADRFNEDRLRILRALRFSIQLGFEMEYHTEGAILKLVLEEGKNMFRGVSPERIRDELYKMFLTSTPKSLKLIFSYPKLVDILFSPENDDLWLMPTFKSK